MPSICHQSEQYVNRKRLPSVALPRRSRVLHVIQFHMNEHVRTLERSAAVIALYFAPEHFDGRILLKLLSK